MFSKFNEEAQKILLTAKKEMAMLKHPYVGSEHLLLAILHNPKLKVTQVLNEYNITYEDFRGEILRIVGEGSSVNEWFLYTPLLKRIIENAVLDSREEENSEVTVESLFISLLEEGDGVAIRTLMGMDIDVDALYDKFADKFIYKNSTSKNKLLIEEYGIDFNERVQSDEVDPVIGRDQELYRMIEILMRRTKNNPLLIGEAGVGKTAIVEELARRITLKKVPEYLQNKRIIGVSMSSLVAGTKYRGEFEERINKMISELEKDNKIILFIDEIHTLVGAGGAEGAIDASNILKPYLARGKIKLIGATTVDEYKKYMENDKALDRRFQKIYIKEPTDEETYQILLHLREIYEDFHGVRIRDEILKSIVSLSSRYISIGKQPDKAIDILDEVCARTTLIDSNYDKKIKKLKEELHNIKNSKNKAIINHDYKEASSNKNIEMELLSKLNKLELKRGGMVVLKEVRVDTLYDVLYDKTHIPIKDLINRNPATLKRRLNKVVIGQNAVVENVVDKICPNFKRKTPYAFLFVGKTGVGKTLFAEEYAKLLYDKDSFIRLDMSEYKESHSVSKIIGSPPGYVGYEDKNTILAKVKLHPYSVILLDEIEKASLDVVRLFLQVFDYGYMTNAQGEKIDFRNTIFFITSNLGCNEDALGFLSTRTTQTLKKVEEFFDKEFINRLDDVVLFQDLTASSIEKIIKQKLEEYRKRYNLKNLISTEVVEKIKKDCRYQEFGARKVDRVIDTLFQSQVSTI